jgi:hypothetical protein
MPPAALVPKTSPLTQLELDVRNPGFWTTAEALLQRRPSLCGLDIYFRARK